MGRIGDFLIGSLAALLLYAAPGCSTVNPTVTENSAATTGLENRLDKEKAERRAAFEQGKVAFTTSETWKIAKLRIKLNNAQYFMVDGCIPNLDVEGCEFGGKLDFCTAYGENDELLFRLRGVKQVEPKCGDLYRRIREELIDYHVEKIEELVKKEDTEINLSQQMGMKFAVITNPAVGTYWICGRNSDGIVENLSFEDNENPPHTKLNIGKNTSQSVEEKIGGLYKLAEKYAQDKK